MLKPTLDFSERNSFQLSSPKYDGILLNSESYLPPVLFMCLASDLSQSSCNFISF